MKRVASLKTLHRLHQFITAIAGPVRHQTPRRAKFSKRGPTRSSAARENHVFWDAAYAWRGVFLRHVTLLVIVIGHRATPKKRGAVKDKLFPAFPLLD